MHFFAHSKHAIKKQNGAFQSLYMIKIIFCLVFKIPSPEKIYWYTKDGPKISYLGTFKAYGFYAKQYNIDSSFGMFSLKQNEKDY
jgi:hypothetical protein